MLRRSFYIVGFSLLVVAALTMTAFAAKSPVAEKRVIDPKIDRSVVYSFPDENNFTTGLDSKQLALGNSSYSYAGKTPGHPSPGVKVGDTWYDYQHNGRQPRMIGWGPHNGNLPTGPAIVHFGWMGLPGPALASRKYYYNFYDASAGSFGTAAGIQSDDEYAGYVLMDVTGDNRAMVGGHNNPGSGYASQAYWDFSPGLGFFSATVRAPNPPVTGAPSPEWIWPDIKYQEGPDTVLHVFSQYSAAGAGDPQPIVYNRKVGVNDAGTWDTPRIVDTVFDISQSIACDPNGSKVALVWLANLPNPGGCDTCSGESTIQVQWDNDVYYQISNDQGVTWQKRVNLTKNQNGVAGFRPYDDLSCLLDAANNLHIVWSSSIWPADPGADGWSAWAARLFHWSENNPYIRTVSSADFSQTTCGPGVWSMNIAKMSVSECDGKIYVLWAQFNDPGVIMDDCAARAAGGTGDTQGSANGDLWISISSDGGLTWDAARNITHSFSPGCDPANGGAPCYSDMWPSMAQYGRANQGGDNWSGAVTVDPTGSYAGSNFLDVQYVADLDAGGIIQDEGTWQLDDIRWFRLACVEPVPNPLPSFSWTKIADPAWTKPGTELDTPLVVENIGNVTLNYTLSKVQDNGPANWLLWTGATGSIPSGLNNTQTITVRLNAGGVYAGTGIELVGRLIFTSNAPSSPDTVPINFFVVDTLVKPIWDTLYAGCVSLTVGNNGNFGNQGKGKVNMDFVRDGGDCDTTATIYLYDGSPVLGWISGTDTVFNWSIFGKGYLDSTGFRPIGGQQATTLCSGVNIYQTGVFVTHDSSIAMRKVWVAPSNEPSNCDFVIEKLEVWSYDGLAHNGLTIGEAADFDIPSDTASYNTGGFDFAKNLIYQRGLEQNKPSQDSTECQNNDARFGGMAFIKSYLNGTQHNTVPYSAYVAENDSFVYPASGFVAGQLYQNMHQSGFTVVDSTEDLHTVMCYEPNLNLGATDHYVAYIIYASVENGTATDLSGAVTRANNWFTSKNLPTLLADNDANGLVDACEGCCVGMRGNIDNDPADAVDIGDLVYLVEYSFSGGPAPACEAEADVNGDTAVDIGDLVYMVEYSFSGGPSPVSCN